MALKKKKKIIKSLEVEEILEDLQNQVEKQYVPDNLKSNVMKMENERRERIDQLRFDQVKSFILPEGYSVRSAIAHDYIDKEDPCLTAEKEVSFWRAYKPNMHYEIIRHGEYITYILQRPATESEEKLNRKKRGK